MGWKRFRSWPWWGQALVWVAAWPAALGVLAWSRPPAERRPWALLAAAGLVMWLGVAASGNQPPADDREPVSATADVELEPVEPREARSSARPTTTEAAPTTSTTIATTTTTAAPTTVPPPTAPPPTAPPTTRPPTALPPPPTAPPPTAPPSVVVVLPAPPTTAPPPPVQVVQSPICHPSYSGCLDANAADYDCAGGGGDGPRYTPMVQVFGSDPFRLDSDGDGIGCEVD